jgi:hypothetical protein
LPPCRPLCHGDPHRRREAVRERSWRLVTTSTGEDEREDGDTEDAALSAPTDGETAAAADAMVNTNSPTENIRRRPNRSPSAAPVRSMQANERL